MGYGSLQSTLQDAKAKKEATGVDQILDELKKSSNRSKVLEEQLG